MRILFIPLICIFVLNPAFGITGQAVGQLCHQNFSDWDSSMENQDSYTEDNIGQIWLQGNIKFVKSALKNGMDVDTKNPGGAMLHYAAKEALMNSIEYLVSKGANLNIRNGSGLSPLHSVIMNDRIKDEDRIKVIKFLISKGANPNIQNKVSATPIHLAAQSNKKEKDILKFFLSAHKESVHLRDNIGNTVLHYLRETDKNLVKKIVGLGVDINVRNDLGDSPLHWAILRHDVEYLKILLALGADTEARDHLERTPLHYAVFEHHELVQILLDKKAEVDAQDVYGWTPLHLAIKIDRDSNFNTRFGRLLKQGANVNLKDEQGETPVSLAVINNKLQFLKKLLNHGADINTQNHEGNTPLHLVVNNNFRSGKFKPWLKVLSEYEIDVNLKEFERETPVPWAVIDKRLNILQLLLNHGADINTKNHEGNTPLHLAVIHSIRGRGNAISFLLKKGADTGIKNNKGKTPMDLAKEKGVNLFLTSFH